jgi:glutaconyl-CoA/methylmalonyl-CoA decarboxylase subunit gamma
VRYYVKLTTKDPAPLVVDVHDLPSGALEVLVNGRKVDADVVSLGEQLSIRVDGKVVDLTTEGAAPEVGIIGRGYRSYVEVESERQRAANAVKKVGGAGSENVQRAPMPGRIVKVLVAKGDVVAPGQPLVVMEAMKMENEIKAKSAATIAEVHVVTGATVEGGAKLVTLA